ncbi:DUF5009 domain-containing protein [uncultured Bacteroides sp.]|uniref:acyltransferase family protein n=1 Tax=uncultured Bacteroides sp. TaxID=162156 RepID=UPI002AA95E65|nr:DUF5009 domain-containing protein [uncultured Bacteroides sp.]
MEQKTNRLQSIDALRGFDMCWIMGVPGIIYALSGIFGSTTLAWCSEQMEHVPWDGFHLMDLVFPLFLFIAGVSFPFSLSKRRERNTPYSALYLHIVKRTAILILLGFIYNGWLALDVASFRFASVLAHIGLAWCFGALLYMHIRKEVVIWACVLSILIGYALLNLCVLAPDAIGTNPFVPENNIVAWFDRSFLPGVLYNGNYDPEGFLSILLAIATALLGMICGNYLMRIQITPSRKAFTLFLFGVALLVLSVVTEIIIPYNKALWSSSFVLLTGGISILLLSLFYWVIDVLHFTRWSFFFRVIGLNSIAIYIAQRIVDFYGIDSFFLSGVATRILPGIQSLLLSAGYVAVCWLFLWFLYKKNIFIKV